MKILFVTQGKFWNWENASRLRAKSVLESFAARAFSVEVLHLGSLTETDLVNFAKHIPHSIALKGCQSAQRTNSRLNEVRWLYKLIPKAEFIRSLVQRALVALIPVKFLDAIPTRWRRLFSGVRAMLDLSPYAYAGSQIEATFVSTLVRFKPEIVYIRCLDAAWIARASLAHGVVSLMDAADVVHQRRESLLEGGLINNIYANRVLEQQLLEKVDTILAIQLADAHVFRQLMPKKKVVHVGQPFNAFPCKRLSNEEIVFGFLASEGAPNHSALQEILENIWPRIQGEASCPVRFVVAGRVSSSVQQTPSGVEVLGVVGELSDFYDRVDVILSVLRYGGGLKFKTVEGLAFGKVVMATDCGAEGVSPEVNAALVRVNTIDEIVQAATALTRNRKLMTQYKQQAFDTATAHFSLESVYAPMFELFAHLNTQARDKKVSALQ